MTDEVAVTYYVDLVDENTSDAFCLWMEFASVPTSFIKDFVIFYLDFLFRMASIGQDVMPLGYHVKSNDQPIVFIIGYYKTSDEALEAGERISKEFHDIIVADQTGVEEK